jgi:hypothetical protein
MVPFPAFEHALDYGSPQLQRYNGSPATSSWATPHRA